MHRILPFLLACLLLVLFRIAGSWFPEALPNFQPLAALFFCGVWMAPGARGFLLPLALWALTFPLGAGHPPGAQSSNGPSWRTRRSMIAVRRAT